jgi:UDP-2,3-diacylglucosamine pyrophosphatase LpxH
MDGKFLILSDFHLGSKVTRHDMILKVLETPAETIILNGDIIDIDGTHRLNKKDWKVLSVLRKLSKHSSIHYLAGNHCQNIGEVISELLGFEFHRQDYSIRSENLHIYMAHGDIWDTFIGDHPFLTNVAGAIYYYLQRLNPHNQKIPRWLKQRSKSWLGAANRVKHNAIKYAKNHGFDVIIAGHTHLAEEYLSEESGIYYYNLGCFTDYQCSYVVVNGRDVRLHYI